MNGHFLSWIKREFWLPGACTTFTILWVEGLDISTPHPPSTTLLPSQRCFEFQPDSANGVPKERHTAYSWTMDIEILPPRAWEGICAVKTVRSKRDWGVLWRIIYFGNRVSRCELSWFLTNSTNLCFSQLHSSPTILKVHILVNTAKGKGVVGWLVELDWTVRLGGLVAWLMNGILQKKGMIETERGGSGRRGDGRELK